MSPQLVGAAIAVFVCLLVALQPAAVAYTIPEDADSFLPTPPRYHHTDDIATLFHRLAKEHPGLVSVHSVGRSRANRDLLVLQIGRSAGDAERQLLVPMFKYVANMHGDETIGRELLVYLAQYLLANYGRVAAVTRLVDTTDIYLMPSMNPDGFEESVVSRAEREIRQAAWSCICAGCSMRTVRICLGIPTHIALSMTSSCVCDDVCIICFCSHSIVSRVGGGGQSRLWLQLCPGVLG